MTAADELVAFLRTRGGEAPAAACSEHLRARGYGSAARKSAKERARVVSRKSGYGGRWLWRLADDVEGAAVVPVAAAPAPSPSSPSRRDRAMRGPIPPPACAPTPGRVGTCRR